MKALLKRGSESMRLTNGRDSIIPRRPSMINRNVLRMNSFMNSPFFEDDNYRSILRCLDEGYSVFTDLIDLMKDRSELLRDHAENLKSYSKKWQSRIRDQSTLSSYHTTKHAQQRTVQNADDHAPLLIARCDAIDKVIEDARRQVDRMYIQRNLGRAPKHRRTDQLKTQFKTARAPVDEAQNEVENLRKKVKDAQQSLHEADIQCENAEYSTSKNSTKLSRATELQQDRKIHLKALEERLTGAETDLQKEKEIYQEKATKIFRECQTVEKERLELIRQILMNYNQVVHTEEYSQTLDQIHQDLLGTIKNDQNTEKDLHWWSKSYGVDAISEQIIEETPQSVTTTTVTVDEQQPTAKSNKTKKNSSTTAQST